jgi:hypothetical protein
VTIAETNAMIVMMLNGLMHVVEDLPASETISGFYDERAPALSAR